MTERITEQTRPLVDAQIAKSWSGPFLVSKGVLHDSRTQPGFAAFADGELAGYALYNIANGECEMTVLESLRQKRGVGGALINAVIEAAKESNCRRVWLITSNDNTHAIRFYQRFGFSLKAVYIDAMDVARQLKPQIPLLGEEGIPLQHEFEFEIVL